MQSRKIAGLFVLVSFASLAQARDGDYLTWFGTNGGEQIGFDPSLDNSTSFVSFTAVAIQPDGKLLVSASPDVAAMPPSDVNMGVLRLNPNGTRDTGFGTQGQTIVSFNLGGDNKDVVSAVRLQANGRILLCGTAAGEPTTTGSDFAVARLLANGTPDTQFSADGKTTVGFDLGPSEGRDDMAVRCALQADSKIVIAGQAALDNTGVANRMAVARLNTDGSRDTGFNGTGTATVDFGPAFQNSLAFSVKAQADGRTLLIGRAADGGDSLTAKWAFARLDSSGHPDNTFGNGGIFTFDPGVPGYLAFEALDAVVLPDDSFIAVGVFALMPALTNFDYGVFKLKPDGSLDTTFGSNGGQIIAFDLGGALSDAAVEVAQDRQGRFVIAGFSASSPIPVTTSVVRLLPDGQFDTSFGLGGKLSVSSTAPPATDFGEQGTSVAIAPDDSIVLGSIANHSSPSHLRAGLMRLVGDTIFGDGFDFE
jgi:uncharacterized delta-60 repeat protein